MLTRRDKDLKVVGDVTVAKYVRLDELWRGLNLRAGAAFTIPDVRRFVNFRTFPAHCGWMVETTGDLEVKVAFLDSETGEERSSRLYSGLFQPLMLPWPHAISGALDLSVGVSDNAKGESEGNVFIANHRALSRQWLLDAAVGTGVSLHRRLA